MSENKDQIVKELQEAVDKFNEDMMHWVEKYQCVANFSWEYSGGKKMTITSIDKIIFRKEVPNFQKISELMPKT